MGTVRRMIAVARGQQATPTHADFQAWHNAIYNGKGNARGFGRATILDALHGLNVMITRDPQRLIALRDADDVCALVLYARERRSTSV